MVPFLLVFTPPLRPPQDRLGPAGPGATSPGRDHPARIRSPQRWAPGGWALLGLVLGLAAAIEPAALAQQANPTICCRTSGGTRGTCLNLWLHLVPPSNRFNPGRARTLALLQGASPQPAALTVQFLRDSGDVVAEHTLSPQGPSIRLITLPADWLPPRQPLSWESFPTCQPNKPPTRTTLVALQDPEQLAAQQTLATLARACGTSLDPRPLLQAFGLEESVARFQLPERLPVHCEALSPAPLNLSSPQGPETRP
jgi:hypothetical protein